MENPAPFDLNRAIQQWRDELAQSPDIGSQNLDELESHLRDSIATLECTGLTDEEAFLIATRRCGGPKQLRKEFRKLNLFETWFYRACWLIIATLATPYLWLRSTHSPFYGDEFGIITAVSKVAALLLAIAALNTYLLRQIGRKDHLGPILKFTYPAVLVLFAVSLLLAGAATFQNVRYVWSLLHDPFTFDTYLLFERAMISRSFWLSYIFSGAQAFVLAFVLAANVMEFVAPRHFIPKPIPA